MKKTVLHFTLLPEVQTGNVVIEGALSDIVMMLITCMKADENIAKLLVTSVKVFLENENEIKSRKLNN